MHCGLYASAELLRSAAVDRQGCETTGKETRTVI